MKLRLLFIGKHNVIPRNQNGDVIFLSGNKYEATVVELKLWQIIFFRARLAVFIGDAERPILYSRLADFLSDWQITVVYEK